MGIPNLSHINTNSSSRFSLPLSNPTSEGAPIYIAINDYNKRMEDELDLKLGDKIHVITNDEEFNDGWYYGKNLRTQEEGLYPVVFTQKLAAEIQQLTQEKSQRRISTLFSSTSELPTLQALETADFVKIKSANSPETPISLKNTMSDIDRALEELQRASTSETGLTVTHESENGDFTHDTFESEYAETSTNTQSGSIGLTANPLSRNLDFATSRSTSNNTTIVNDIGTVHKVELDPKNILNWTPEDVTNYFVMCGFDPEASAKFSIHKISGEILLELELTHLKELDIDSFGTRFEIFKEIEAIKEIISNDPDVKDANRNDMINKRASRLMPAAQVDQIQYSQKLGMTSPTVTVELPSNSTTPPTSKQASEQLSNSQKLRPASIAIPSNYENGIPGRSPLAIHGNSMFTSPRKAPKPPSYPSPVQPQSSKSARFRSPSTSTEKANSNVSTPQSLGSKSDKFMFPQHSNGNSNYVGNRSSAIYLSHKKSVSGGSFVDLFNRVSLLSPGNEDRKSSIGVSETNEKTLSITANYSKTGSTSHSKSGSVSHSKVGSVSHLRKTSQTNVDVKKHRRNSSLLSFFSSKTDERPVSPMKPSAFPKTSSRDHSRNSSYVVSPYKSQYVDDALEATSKDTFSRNISTPTPLKASSKSPTKEKKRRSVSARENITPYNETKIITTGEEMKKRSVSEATKDRNVRKNSNKPTKQGTTAFMEGIKSISVKDAILDADCSGWMSKKGSGPMGTWKTRFFTLHDTRLSYFSNTTDTRERGLIDITGHRVVPAREDDKLVSLYAASTGKGRYCFKLVPPQPGSRKGLTFTQPNVHYFAVDSNDDMRAWMAALIKTSIDIDTTVPVVSSYSTATVSLPKAQEMLLQAREETILREKGRLLNEEDEDQMVWENENRTQDSKKKIRNSVYVTDTSSFLDTPTNSNRLSQFAMTGFSTNTENTDTTIQEVTSIAASSQYSN